MSEDPAASDQGRPDERANQPGGDAVGGSPDAASAAPPGDAASGLPDDPRSQVAADTRPAEVTVDPGTEGQPPFGSTSAADAALPVPRPEHTATDASAPDPVAAAALAAPSDSSTPMVEDTGQMAGDELEELALPPSVQAPEALAQGAVLGPDGRLRVEEHLGVRGRTNRYAATWQDQAGRSVDVELREGPADHEGLAREAEVLASVEYTMLPVCHAAFEHDGRRYLAIDRLPGETLERALQEGRPPDQVVSIVLQLAQVLRRLHAAGWALVGLAPTDVCLGQPVRLAQLGSAVRIGQPPPHALHVAGYSAPELAHRSSVTGKEDVYTLGAILYRALAGHPLSEAGAELAGLPSAVPIAGGPQLLGPALAPPDERVDLEAFYQQLLAFKRRLAYAPLALEVASATSVGLNPTRPINEDSCGYVTWSVSVAEGASYRALLCVADGMGGMDAGEMASGTALRTILAGATAGVPAALGEPVATGQSAPSDGTGPSFGGGALLRPAHLDPVALIKQAAPAVHAAGAGRQMGTTATCVAVEDGKLTLGHVGDTRAYLLRDGALSQLTADHSLVAAMVASGILTKEEARGHPDSNKVLRSLGSQRQLPDGYVDDLTQAYGQPSLQLRPGDWLLLCTDGVWGSVDDERLRATVVEAADCPTVARLAIEQALRAGAPDNAAIVVARCVRMPAS